MGISCSNHFDAWSLQPTIVILFSIFTTQPPGIISLLLTLIFLYAKHTCKSKCCLSVQLVSPWECWNNMMMGWLDDHMMRWWNDWMTLMTGWPVDWMTKGPMMGLLDDQMTGWLDDWMTGWPDVQMTRWPDDRKLCRRLTIWYILILTALNLNAQTTSMLRHHSSYCGQFAVLFWEISILDHNMKLV